MRRGIPKITQFIYHSYSAADIAGLITGAVYPYLRSGHKLIPPKHPRYNRKWTLSKRHQRKASVEIPRTQYQNDLMKKTPTRLPARKQGRTVQKNEVMIA